MRMLVSRANRWWREACGTRSRTPTAASTRPSAVSCRAKPKAEETVVGFVAHTSPYSRIVCIRSVAGSCDKCRAGGTFTSSVIGVR